MRIGEAARTGFLEILCHKMRSFLSFSSVAFGVAAILYTFAQVNHTYEGVQKKTALSGPGRMEIHQKYSRKQNNLHGLSRGLTLGDAEAIRKNMPELYMVAPTRSGYGNFNYGAFKTDLGLRGITLEWTKRDWAYTLRGRFINQQDIDQAARVCVVTEPGGWSDENKRPSWWGRWYNDVDDFKSFIKRTDLLGRTVRVNNQLLTVVGILQEPPIDKDPRGGWGSSQGGELTVPITTLQRYFSSDSGDRYVPESINNISVDTGSEKIFLAAKHRIENLLDSRHRGEKDFEIEDLQEEIEKKLQVMRKNAIAVLSIGLVAILSGGIGIMNVTLATIFSRIREIGIRRALGATRFDILVQFVIEAMLLGTCGGVAGIGLGLAGLRYLVEDGTEKIQSLHWWHFPATLAISAAVGFLFSLYPAHTAARLDPVEALRYE